MTRPVVWSERALDSAAGFIADDSQGLRQLLDTVDRLADDAQPKDSIEYGSPDLRRLRVGRYRILYEINDVITDRHPSRPTGLNANQSLEGLIRAGLSRSEAARTAFLEAERAQRPARLRAEAESLRDDPEDVAAARDLTAETDAIRAG